MTLPDQSNSGLLDPAKTVPEVVSDALTRRSDVDTMTPEQEERFREELDAISDKIGELDALTSFLVGLKITGSQRPRVARIAKATANARTYLPDSGRKLGTYDAERATAFATTAIAEAVTLVLERALAARGD